MSTLVNPNWEFRVLLTLMFSSPTTLSDLRVESSVESPIILFRVCCLSPENNWVSIHTHRVKRNWYFSLEAIIDLGIPRQNTSYIVGRSVYVE